MGFQFNDNIIHLDIAGVNFDINYTPQLLKDSKEFGEKAMAKSKDLDVKKSREEYNKAIDESINLMKDTINLICGEGATDKIFKNRQDNFYDYIDVVKYIQGEVIKFQNKNKDRFDKYSPNRAQRRAVEHEHVNRSNANKRKNR